MWDDATWIGAAAKKVPGKLPPGTLLRRLFELPAGFATASSSRAFLYIAAAGFYKCKVDGKAVSTHVLGATTDFWKRLYYHTHDVSSLLHKDPLSSTHVISCDLGRGRYGEMRNSIGAKSCTNGHGGCKPAIKVKLSIRAGSSNGPPTTVVSDGSWHSLQSPVLDNDMYAGETYNASLERPNFDLPPNASLLSAPSALKPGGISDAMLANASTNSTGLGAPFADVRVYSSYLLPPVKVIQSFAAVDLWRVKVRAA
jgi:alpha-L-rhamnosidase